MDDLLDRIDGVIASVVEARAMPLSTSCVLSRADLLAELTAVRELVPVACAEAAGIVAERDEILRRATAQAKRIVAEARLEGRRLVSEDAITVAAERQAAERLEHARESAEEMRAQIDRYVDHKLARFEDALGQALASVTRGRQRLAQSGSAAAPSGHSAATGASRTASAPPTGTTGTTGPPSVQGASTGPHRGVGLAVTADEARRGITRGPADGADPGSEPMIATDRVAAGHVRIRPRPSCGPAG